MAKEYVGYSGEEPSSPGHSVAAVTWEGEESVQAISATSAGPFSAASESKANVFCAVKEPTYLIGIHIFRLT